MLFAYIKFTQFGEFNREKEKKDDIDSGRQRE